MKPIDRRTVLIGGGIGVGLIVALAAWPEDSASEGGGEGNFGPFIRIAKSGSVTIAVPQVETGQGAWTALPQIVADELGAAWETVGVEPAPLGGAFANPLAEHEGWLADHAFGVNRQPGRALGRQNVVVVQVAVQQHWRGLRGQQVGE